MGCLSTFGCWATDVFVVADNDGKEMILKLHRLGRTSFQTVTRNRDYTRRPGQRGGAGWLYLSRLAAQKVVESVLLFPFLQAHAVALG